MSDVATTPAPPPNAWPWTSAITGAGHVSIASKRRWRPTASATFSSCERSAERRIHSTSAPAQKLRPSPARTTARAVPTSTNASASAEIMAPSKAFLVSGRANVRRRTSPSRSVLNASTGSSTQAQCGSV
jgi:hypothetical protein